MSVPIPYGFAQLAVSAAYSVWRARGLVPLPPRIPGNPNAPRPRGAAPAPRPPPNAAVTAPWKPEGLKSPLVPDVLIEFPTPSAADRKLGKRTHLSSCPNLTPARGRELICQPVARHSKTAHSETYEHLSQDLRHLSQSRPIDHTFPRHT